MPCTGLLFAQSFHARFLLASHPVSVVDFTFPAGLLPSPLGHAAYLGSQSARVSCVPSERGARFRGFWAL